MTDHTLSEFYSAYENELAQRPGLRLGQAAFNTLYRLHPDLADQVRCSEVDPFYDNSRLPRFFAFIQENWASEEAPSLR